VKEEKPLADWNELTDEEFREEAARSFDTWCPSDQRFYMSRQRWKVVKPWFLTLTGKGWIAPGWPVEYGGMGLSPAKHLIYIEEYEKCGAPRLLDQSLTNLGPILIARGDEAQRQRYLPSILAGDHVWCQGYSEPGAGSDLAGVRTEARIEGDELVIDGHKIWTTMAMDATHMFALVRTDKNVKKQAGITFVMFPMDQPGIEVRPIRDITGLQEFCEVFLTSVRASLSDVVGGLGGGWGVTKTLLGFERVWSGSPRQSMIALAQLEQVAKKIGIFDQPAFQDKFIQLSFDVADLAATYERSVRTLDTGSGFGYEASLLKIIATETCQRISELMIETAGETGAFGGEVALPSGGIDVLKPFLESRGPTIYGGSSQIQRNILAKRALGLPDQ
jgi:alkylation response protein AidB-like acyl-CoA dehydrogenase